MAVPDYQTLMRPVLAQHDDDNEHAVRDVRASVAADFGLSEDDLAERLPSGRARTFDNRVGWATTYLYRAGLLSRTRRSHYRITGRGRQVLQSHPKSIDNNVLGQFQEFLDFRSRRDSEPSPAPVATGVTLPVPSEDETPQERMHSAYVELRDALAEELLDRIIEQDFAFFERLVIDVLTKMGYGSGEQLGGSGDGGVDGMVNEDRLGLDRIYVQAKRWTNSVSRPDVQGFVGALAGRGATKGVFITTSVFTQGAKDYVITVQPRIVLIDGKRLANLMLDYGVAVSTETEYSVMRLDLDYFADEGSAVPAEAS